jgi:hypothetical protein
MNVETRANENQDLIAKEELALHAAPTAEVLPMPTDCFKLVGGGSAIFLFD